MERNTGKVLLQLFGTEEEVWVSPDKCMPFEHHLDKFKDKLAKDNDGVYQRVYQRARPRTRESTCKCKSEIHSKSNRQREREHVLVHFISTVESFVQRCGYTYHCHICSCTDRWNDCETVCARERNGRHEGCEGAGE